MSVVSTKVSSRRGGRLPDTRSTCLTILRILAPSLLGKKEGVLSHRCSAYQEVYPVGCADIEVRAGVPSPATHGWVEIDRINRNPLMPTGGQLT